MRTNVHVLYIPGLGDAHASGQRAVVWTWRFWGVEAELFQMHWADSEPWESKLARLLQRIDILTANGNLVGLVGASAGASAVVTAYALRRSQVIGCVLIAGKVNHPESIVINYRQKNPAFIFSAQDCEKALRELNATDRRKILSRYALYDEVVAKRDSHIDGARNQVIPIFGHAFTIGQQILFGARSFLDFLEGLTYPDGFNS